MFNKISNPFDLTAIELQELLGSSFPFPELKKAVVDIHAFAGMKQTKIALETGKEIIANIREIPLLSDELYRSYAEIGKRNLYLKPHDARRTRLSMATLLFLLGRSELKPIIENYLLAICDERTWVVPPHEGRLIDLYAADTAVTLADVIFTVGDKLDNKIIEKVRKEIKKRIYDPYLNQTSEHKWHKSNDNWNAVCNSQIAITFLLLEKDRSLVSQAIKTAFECLKVYVETAFNKDGSTSEGINYWHYGISWFAIFSEMLRASSNGSIDLLTIDRIKSIASYPLKIQLSSEVFASFSDVDVDELAFNAGVIQKIAERTSEKSLLGLIVDPVVPDYHGLTSVLRFILWWDGKTHPTNILQDSVLPDAGIVRFVTKVYDEIPITIAIKAGHNGENHNHNDVGSFLINVDGENFVTDPGAGLYDKNYFGDNRYENIFANSYGHSVPRIDKKLQSTGKNFYGELIDIEHDKKIKRVLLEFEKAYDINSLVSAKRTLQLPTQEAKELIFEDNFEFLEKSLEIEEAFITWLDVEVSGRQAIIHCKRYDLNLIIHESITLGDFQLEKLEKESRENEKSGVLKRISFTIPASENKKILFRMKIQIIKP